MRRSVWCLFKERNVWATGRTNFNNMSLYPGSWPSNYHTECWWACCPDNRTASEATRLLEEWGDVAGVSVCVWGDMGLKVLEWKKGVLLSLCERLSALKDAATTVSHALAHLIQTKLLVYVTAAPLCKTYCCVQYFTIQNTKRSLYPDSESWGFAPFLCLLFN